MAPVQVNQFVWFWRDGQGRGNTKEPAIVTAIHDGEVDLWVFCQHGAQRVETKVPIRGEGSTVPIVRYATVKAG
jgi:hypothetical protein